MKKQQYLIVIVLNLAIALGFYWDGRDANAMHISSDQANIIPVCQKLDHPDWFAEDMILNEVDNIAYYTPAFIEALRFTTRLADGNYFQGLNLLGFWTHWVYGVLWFLLLYRIRPHFGLALVFSLLMRGIIWPPGGELLGISDLWTIVPRTVYGALLPLPFLLYVYLPRAKVFVSSLVLGLILNLHPISGIGGIVAYMTAFAVFLYTYHSLPWQKIIRLVAIASIGVLVGMLPYLVHYFSTVSTAVVDQTLFEAALNLRLDTTFSDPIVFVQAWNRPVLYLLLAGMIALFFVDDTPRKRAFYLLAIAALVVFVSANLSVYIERAINALAGTNLRLSFQLIRFQKYILVIFQLATYLTLAAIIARLRWKEVYVSICVVGLLLVSSLSLTPPFKKLPLIGDDLISHIVPNAVMLTPRPLILNNADRIALFDYIKTHTPREAKLYGHTYIRAAAERSVVLDIKGASMLIEGNQQAFIQWYLDYTHLHNLSNKAEQIDYLRAYGVDYIAVDEPWPLEEVKRIGKCYLYRL